MSSFPEQLKPQGGVWRCAVTALEYLTGTSRENIAHQIGHDGGYKPESTKARFANGTSTYEDAFAFIGVLSDEIQWWAARQNLPYYVLKSREYLRASCDPDTVEDIYHPLVSIPTTSEVFDFIRGKSALVTVPFPEVKDRTHVIAWLGDTAIDPMHGMKRHLAIEEIIEAMVFPSIDPRGRLQGLYPKGRQCSVTEGDSK